MRSVCCFFRKLPRWIDEIVKNICITVYCLFMKHVFVRQTTGGRLKNHTCLQVCQVPFGLKSPDYSFAGFPADNLELCQNMVPPHPLVEIIVFLFKLPFRGISSATPADHFLLVKNPPFIQIRVCFPWLTLK